MAYCGYADLSIVIIFIVLLILLILLILGRRFYIINFGVVLISSKIMISSFFLDFEFLLRV